MLEADPGVVQGWGGGAGVGSLQSPVFPPSSSRVCATTSELRYLQGPDRDGDRDKDRRHAGACGGRGGEGRRARAGGSQRREAPC